MWKEERLRCLAPFQEDLVTQVSTGNQDLYPLDFAYGYEFPIGDPLAFGGHHLDGIGVHQNTPQGFLIPTHTHMSHNQNPGK